MATEGSLCQVFRWVLFLWLCVRGCVRPPANEKSLLFDALVATAFAGIVWDMFKSFSPKSSLLPMQWFVVAAGASVLYDLYSTVLIACARSRKKRDEGARVVSNYAKTVKYWLAQDGAFLLLAMLLWWAFSKWGLNWPLVIAFTVVCIGVLVADVWFPSPDAANPAPAHP